MLFQLGPFLGLDVVALLALDLKLLLGAQQFDEGLRGPVALLESGADNPQITTLTVAVARRP